MTFTILLLRNLLYHWRGNLAVFLGIALGSAILTGALFVGDSLRGSLKALTLDQLGWVEQAMLPGRFFRAELGKETGGTALLMLQGSATAGDGAKPIRAGKVVVLGIESSFWPGDEVPQGSEFWQSTAAEVVLNQALASALGAKVGDVVTLHLQKPSNIPRELLLGQRKIGEIVEPMRAKVRAIVPQEGMGRFSLKPSPEPVRNAFVPLRFLQKKADQQGRANVLLGAGAPPVLKDRLKLEDWELRWRSPRDRALGLIRFLDPFDVDGGELRRPRWSVKLSEEEAAAALKRGEKLIAEKKGDRRLYWRSRVPELLADAANENSGILSRDIAIAFYEKHRNYYLLESRRLVLPAAIVNTVRELETQRSDAVAEISVYLADSLFLKRDVPYSIVAAVDTKRGPRVSPDGELTDKQIIAMTWPGMILPVAKGRELAVTYLSPDDKNQLVPKVTRFIIKELVPIAGPFDDPDLTPEFPGITDQAKMDDWKNPPFPYDKKRITKSDEEYWERYRTTPKAYINMATANRLWGSRFGDITSVRIAKLGGLDPATLPAELLKALTPESGGFVFQNVRQQAEQASGGATDFRELFLYFSFFLIVAALLLVGLLVRLNMDRRAAEMGLLLALGWDHGKVRWLLLAEGAVLAALGGLIGLAGALVYGDLMLKFLAANWPGGEGLGFLNLHTEPASFVTGFSASLLVSLVTLLFATRGLARLSPRSLLAGQTAATIGLADARVGWSRWLIPAGAVGAIGLGIYGISVPAGMVQAGCFFGSGALLLIACLAAVWGGLKRSNAGSSPQPSLSKLGLRNAGRHAVRSVLTVGLLAASSFLIVAVESFHKGTGHQFQEKTGGSGGFALYAEGNTPIFEDLDDPAVRHRLGLDTPEMPRVRLYPCRVQAGDDASCLNLYKPLKPRVLAFSKTLINRGGFEFATPGSPSNPWRLLEGDSAAGIPAIVDANTAEWILKVKPGDTVEINDDNGKPVKLRIVALLHESVFQSEIIISEANFLKMFPRQEGFSFFLIDTATHDPAEIHVIDQQLGSALAGAGMDVATTQSRLQGYLAVENMYLATFQALGALGLILGAAGLAIVLLRGVWERRGELALLAALGFGPGQLAWLVLVENGFLLALGLAAGTVSALLAVAPHLAGAGAQVLWLHIAGLLAAVLLVGLISAGLAVGSTLRTPILTALRRE